MENLIIAILNITTAVMTALVAVNEMRKHRHNDNGTEDTKLPTPDNPPDNRGDTRPNNRWGFDSTQLQGIF